MMEVKNNRFYVVSVGQTKTVEQDKVEAIRKLMEAVQSNNMDVEKLKPEIVEVDTSVHDKWNLKALGWDSIALELMRIKK